MTIMAGQIDGQSHLLRVSVSALIPILAVIVLSVTRLLSGSLLAALSLPVFCVSLLMPAVGGMGLRSGMSPGWEMFAYSFFPGCLTGLFPLAAMGAIANVSFIAGYLGCLYFLIGRGGLSWTRWIATFGCCMSLLAIIPLGLHFNHVTVGIGHGLWVASLLALALGCHRMEQEGPEPPVTGCRSCASLSFEAASVILPMGWVLVVFSLLFDLDWLALLLTVAGIAGFITVSILARLSAKS
jgi:hypothetical protein